MDVNKWRVRKVGAGWHIFEPGWAWTSIADQSTHAEAVTIALILRASRATTRRPRRTR